MSLLEIKNACLKLDNKNIEIYFSNIELSLIEFSKTNQWPGGVSESGPSAQYSAKTLV